MVTKERGHTPNTISQFMARLNCVEPPPVQNFVKVYEPACGAGGMVLAIAQVLSEIGKNSARAMWAQCQDIDRTAVLMCFTQLSLWNIPAVVIMGDTLANEVRECFYTPAHYLGAWGHGLAWAERRDCQGAEPEAVNVDQAWNSAPAEPVQMRWIF